MKWVCPSCAELLHGSRHWSVERHIGRKHGGIGEPISLNTGETRSQMDGRSSYSHFPYSRGGSLNDFSSNSPSSSGKKSQPTDMSDWFEKYFLKPLRQNVEFINLYEQLQSRGLPNAPQPPPVPFNNNYNYFPSLFYGPLLVDRKDLFGCRAYHCKNCLSYEKQLFYFSEQQDNNESRITGIEHTCCPNPLEKSLTDNEKDIIIGYVKLNNLIPLGLKYQILNQWSKYDPFHLYAIKLQNPSDGKIIKFTHYADPSKSVLLQYSPRNVIELRDINENHWALRAIKQKIQMIILPDEELIDFLNTAHNATFGFFNLESESSGPQIWLMILTPHFNLNLTMDKR